MISNEKRTRIVERIRHNSSDNPVVWRELQDILGLPSVLNITRAKEYLADLVGPQPVRMCHVVSEENHTALCSECGHVLSKGAYLPNFCSNCGAKVAPDQWF